MGEQRLTPAERRRARQAARLIPGVAAQQDAQNAIAQAQRNRNTQNVSPYEQRRRAAAAEALRQRRLAARREQLRQQGQAY